jgi:7,8-dihydropterin-6-yl-methyl-4-(beta-D-ribofuranosyl)aminobenzene 5'-phosphate synthase
MRGIGLTPLDESQQRGESKLELRMDSICCAAHGLSLMIVSLGVP